MITNFKNLARNSLRKKALLIAEAAYEAIDVEKVLGKEIKLDKKVINIKGQNFNLDSFSRIFLIGIGKGSTLACVFLARILDKKLTKGIVLDVKNLKPQISNLKIFVGTHPLPSLKNINATQQIIKLAKSLKKDDLLITFICGGGSALLCGSETELNASQTIFKELTKKGADIIELNTIRKHLSEIKGGNLAKLAYPATAISLIVSDVLNNDLSMVASGPTVYDKTTKIDAERVIKKYLYKSVSQSVLIRNLKETPKDRKYFEKVKNILFLSNREPILAMAEKAKKLGFESKIYSLKIQGEAKKVLLPLLKQLKRGEILLAAGETTVTLGNKSVGKGGRNTEAVLGIINAIADGTIVLSFSSDGHDNTEAAGALADFSTIERIKKLKLNPKKFLDNHDSFNFFKKTNDLIYIEQKTFNVSDLMLVLSSSKE